MSNIFKAHQEQDLLKISIILLHISKIILKASYMDNFDVII